ncbi:MAG TPA: hypothetical protein VH559_07795 [Gemmatimonadaceae bacterium]
MTWITSTENVEFLSPQLWTMPIREFTDSSGTSWLVWATIPPSAGVLGAMRGGWLTFESSVVRRRLIPIPSGWEEATPAKLDLLCRAATPVRRTPPAGFEPMDSDSTEP